MSSIPPTGHAGLIQTQGAQAQAEKTRGNQNANEAGRTQNTSFSDKLKEVIENDDLDSQVYADAEGTGSQGRTFSEEPNEEPEAVEDEAAEDTPGGIDLQA